MKIIIVDDDKIVSASIKTILSADKQMEVVTIGNSGEEAITLYEKFTPDIMLMDIRMSAMTGIMAGKIILEKAPQAKILFLTTFSDNEYIIEALKIGAKGYILKQNYESIVQAIKAVYSGQSVFGDEIITKIPQLFNSQNNLTNLEGLDVTNKEMELIKYVADGLNNKEIADELYLSEGTVRNYISNILEKLELRDRTQLAVFYYKNKNT